MQLAILCDCGMEKRLSGGWQMNFGISPRQFRVRDNRQLAEGL